MDLRLCRVPRIRPTPSLTLTTSTGHLSLVQEAKEHNDVLVASIFVNPTQFGPHEDLAKYPRQLERDCQLLQELGVHHIFAPSDTNDLYGPHHLTFVSAQGFDTTAEGRVRPDHFSGVATIVTKLFNIVRPTNAYFGQKDAAQCVLIRRVVADLDMDVTVVVKDTVREADGLAMSSRNAYLTEEERKAAPVLYRSLTAAYKDFLLAAADSPTIASSRIKEVVQTELAAEPLVSEIQYVSVDSKANMQSIPQIHVGEGAIVSIACKIGEVRLIDNIVL
jgi:pantoate--beta-alanine ligase